MYFETNQDLVPLTLLGGLSVICPSPLCKPLSR
jgi:hypothetical protein